MASVAVVGPGAIGGWFAAQLLAVGRDEVVLCGRRRFDELVLDEDGTCRRHPVRVLTEPGGGRPATPVDVVLLAVKAHQTASAAPWLEVLVGPATTVAVLQNGVEQVDRVRPFVHPDAAIVPAVVYCGAESPEPGHVVHRTNGFLIVPDDGAGRRLATLFEGTGAEVRRSGRWLDSAWMKLCSNVVANGLTALTGRRMEVFGRPDVAEQVRRLAGECVAVARAEGAEIDDGFPDLLAEGLARMPGHAGTSMLYDRLAGRPLEYDAIHGAVVRAARRHGIDVPLHDLLVCVLAALGEPAGGRSPTTTGGVRS
jgi:2-dehydropantoate 2-reductase